MKRLIFASLLFSLTACQDVERKPRPYAVYQHEMPFYETLINKSTDEGSEFFYENKDFPIQVKLYEGVKFHWVLDTLKLSPEGWGTWEYGGTDGNIKLYAETKLFVMKMHIESLDALNADALSIEFSDRFGPKYLPLTKVQ